jgi:endonuclease/exonuclease/phosphatase family metal-dependent hydrolase
MSNFSRRNFVKGIGVALSATALPTLANASSVIFEQEKVKGSHRILSCNIRVALPEDDATGNGWKDRKDACIKIIKNQKPDIIGMQEVLRVQAEDIEKAFPDYYVFGFEGPEMDFNKDTYNGIAKNLVIFSKKRYTMTSAGNYWLSETPEIGGSLSWNTARARHVNWVRLRDNQTGKDFRVLAVHLDHKTQEARDKQAQMIIKECNQYQPEFPQILIGDFNVNEKNPVYKIITDAAWTDTYVAVNGDKEPIATFHGFKGDKYPKKGSKIDFIFTKGNLKTESTSIIKDNVNGIYPSDHYFVSADVTFS